MATLQGLYRPKTVDEATALLAQDAEAKPLAGGATLVAMLNARVIEPAALISLAGIEELKGISVLADGRVRIGAFTRHRDTAACTLALGAGGVVPHAASQIANATVRNMGTIGGSISFADPGLDYPPALVAAGAMVEIASVGGRRTIPATEFFVDWYLTALEPGELVTAVLLPAPDRGVGVYVKHARVAGDYATASVAACLREDGRVSVAVGACGPTPLADTEADALLSSQRSDAAIARAAELLVQRADPLDDVRGSADYRRLLIPRLLSRAVRAVEAAQRSMA
ncbi:FAD binding domain-containing protein [Variovorax sp. DT-64]|uniref:FAD binding domain-containing protein n=1 Tax=Variovorax sp. DT-64 TaxID=3396160 RepID=UPI003F1C8DB0